MTDQIQKEVKPSEEDINIDDTDDVKPDDDVSKEGENDTQSDSSADENEKESDDSDDTDSDDSEDDDSSTDDTDEDSTDEEGGKERLLGRQPEKGSPRRIAGESPREFALRCEVHRLKSQRRSDKSKDLFKTDAKGKVEVNTDALSEEDQALLASYNKEELASFEKMMRVIAKKNGWVNKADLTKSTYKDRGQDALDTFLDKHPEYSADNDPNNELWTRFQEEFSLYKQPSNPKVLTRIFNKIHRDIFDVLPEEDLNKIKAQKQKLKSASHSGAAGDKKVSPPQQSPLDPALKKHLKGFTDEELKELF